MTTRVSRTTGIAAPLLLSLLVVGCGSNTSGDGAEPSRNDAAVSPSDAPERRSGSTDVAATSSESRKEPVTRPDEPEVTFAGVHRAPMGRKVVESSLVNSPGYVPLPDPELLPVERGRRDVEPLGSFELTPEYRESPEALARQIVDYVNAADWRGLYENLMITYEEYETICWPEFPSSRPVTGIEASHAWEILWHHAISGARRGVEDYSIHAPLTFERVEFTVGWKEFTNFNLLDGATIHVTAADGTALKLTFADVFLERNGRWKVYVYKD